MAETQTPNPRGPSPNQRPPRGRPPALPALWYAAGFLVLLAIIQGVFVATQGGQAIPYSEFKSLVRAGKVARR